MQNYIGTHRPAKAVLVTECSMSDNIAAEYPDIEFVRPCNLCPHMKRITLPKILYALESETVAVTVPEDITVRARQAVDRMLAVPSR
jgi:quinolinate synthase